jgi:hypothetical protein
MIRIYKILVLILIVQVMTTCSYKNSHKYENIKLENTLTLGESEEDINKFFIFPISVVADKNGNIYICDTNAIEVKKFDKNGKFLWSLNKRGQGPGEFNRPMDIALDKIGNIYVSDQNNRKIEIFSEEGKYKGGFKTETGAPLEIAVNSKGFIYIELLRSTNENILHKLNSKGELVSSFVKVDKEEENDFIQSAKNGVSFCVDHEDNIIISFRYAYKIQKYSPDEKLLFEASRKLPYTPKPLKEVRPQPNMSMIEGDVITQDITVDKKNNIYVLWGGKADEKGLIIDVFNPKGEFLGSFRSGVKPSYNSQRVFLDENDNLYILEPLEEPRLLRFHIEYH